MSALDGLIERCRWNKPVSESLMDASVAEIDKLRADLREATQMVALSVSSCEHGWKKSTIETLQNYLGSHIENLESEKK